MGRLEDIWATRVTLASVQTATDLTAAHLEVGINAGSKALSAASISQVHHAHLHEVSRDATAAKQRAPAGGNAVLRLMVLATIWNAGWNSVKVVDMALSGKLEQDDIVSQGGRAVCRVHDDSLDSHRLYPRLPVQTIVTADVQNVDGWISLTKCAVSSTESPVVLDERSAANKVAVTSHGNHPWPMARLGLMTTDDLGVILVWCSWSKTATWWVDGSLSDSAQHK